MNACPDFEDRLLDYADLTGSDRLDVDAHLAACPACREYLSALREIDAALTSRVAGIRLDPQQYRNVAQLTRAIPVARLSRLPEWLDFVAACAVCAFGYGMLWQSGIVAYLADVLLASPQG
jgi:anti-sigma factor RsiW